MKMVRSPQRLWRSGLPQRCKQPIRRRHRAYGFTTPVPPGTTTPRTHSAAGAGQRDAAHPPRVEFSFTRAESQIGMVRPTGSEDHPRCRRSSPRARYSRSQQGLCLQPVPLSQWQGCRPENAEHRWPHLRILHAADDHSAAAPEASDPEKANPGLMTRFAQMINGKQQDQGRSTILHSDPRHALDHGGRRAARAKDQSTKTRMFLTLEGRRPASSRSASASSKRQRKRPRQRVPTQPAISFIAYVPPGSLEKGEALVVDHADHCRWQQGHRVHGLPRRSISRTRPGTNACRRSPSYLVRQLYDMQRRRPERGVRLRSWLPSLPTSARKIC